MESIIVGIISLVLVIWFFVQLNDITTTNRKTVQLLTELLKEMKNKKGGQ